MNQPFSFYDHICMTVSSNWSPLRCGIPQGSLLSPLLFNIFMNDLSETVTISSLRLYADDTTQYMADKSPVVLQYTLNQDMERLSSWLDYNYLQANGNKTQAIILGNQPIIPGGDSHMKVTGMLVGKLELTP